MTVYRLDIGDLAEPRRMENGFVRADGRITRVGVFTYQLGSGKTRRELRLPDEVFKADSMASFDLSPLTNNHPGERVNSKNSRKFSVGVVSNTRRDGDFVRADITIQDEEAIKNAEDGKRELSCGYSCDLELAGGTTFGIDGVDDGLKYDAIQRNIRGNHVALVDRGRAGRDVALRLDDDDAIIVDDDAVPAPRNLNPEKTQMVKITIDGVDYEVTEQAAQAIAKIQARADSDAEKIAAALKEVEAERARADKAEEDAKKARDDATDAGSADRIRGLVSERLDLERHAVKVLGQEKADELELSGMNVGDIKRAVVLAVSPGSEAKLDGCADEYLQARFDLAIESFNAKVDTKNDDDKPKPRWKKTDRDNADDDNDRFDADSARKRMLKENFERGRRPLGKKAG